MPNKKRSRELNHQYYLNARKTGARYDKGLFARNLRRLYSTRPSSFRRW
jgi:hypothetical protein